jgi:hypothetical protein
MYCNLPALILLLLFFFVFNSSRQNLPVVRPFSPYISTSNGGVTVTAIVVTTVLDDDLG